MGSYGRPNVYAQKVLAHYNSFLTPNYNSYLTPSFLFSERHSHHKSNSILVNSGIIVIVESADVFHVDEFEYVVYAEGEFVVWRFGVHHAATSREHHEYVALGVLLKDRVVLVGQLAPKATECYILAPLQFLKQWYAVEYLAVEVP